MKARRAVKGKASWTSIWSAYRYRAKTKGFEWQLTRAEFDMLIRQACYYCGQSPELSDGNTVTVKGVRHHYSGLDRRCNEPMYSVWNVVPCCARCNMSKGSLNEQEFIDHVQAIYLHRSTRQKREAD
jgi:hypothetical protein